MLGSITQRVHALDHAQGDRIIVGCHVDLIPTVISNIYLLYLVIPTALQALGFLSWVAHTNDVSDILKSNSFFVPFVCSPRRFSKLHQRMMEVNRP